ncbi:MAG: hypothetical protein EZS28_048970 [Streblomastix strix]|uniref:Uncharacterized protein n=1 Tax=Streblomastix strix TaxID=222440 RepID=A0A5J4TCJ6_9EUKA|nr:MAG: hypothetical protein EZS28_048970 [Streblomastix strix]
MARLVFDSRSGNRSRTPPNGVSRPEMSLKPIIENISEIQIMEKFNPDLIMFEIINESKQYLVLIKDEMEQISTLKLNMQYKIKGDYRITRLKGTISLRLQSKEQMLEKQSETIVLIQKIDQKLESLINALLKKNIITEEDLK